MGFLQDVSPNDVSRLVKLQEQLKPGQLEQFLKIQEASPDQLERILDKLEPKSESEKDPRKKLSLADLKRQGALTDQDLESIQKIVHGEAEQILASMHGDPKLMKLFADLCRDYPEQIAELTPEQVKVLAEITNDGHDLVRKLFELSRKSNAANPLNELIKNKEIDSKVRDKIGELGNVISPSEAAAFVDLQKSLNPDDFEKFFELCLANPDQFRKLLTSPEITPEFVETLLDTISTIDQSLVPELMDEICILGPQKSEKLLATLPAESDEANSNSENRQIMLKNFEGLLKTGKNLSQPQKEKLTDLARDMSPESFGQLLEIANQSPKEFEDLMSKPNLNLTELEKLLHTVENLTPEQKLNLLNLSTNNNVDTDTFQKILEGLESNPETMKLLLNKPVLSNLPQDMLNKLTDIASDLNPEGFEELLQILDESPKHFEALVSKPNLKPEELEQLLLTTSNLSPEEKSNLLNLFVNEKVDDDTFQKVLEGLKNNPEAIKMLLNDPVLTSFTSNQNNANLPEDFVDKLNKKLDQIIVDSDYVNLGPENQSLKAGRNGNFLWDFDLKVDTTKPFSEITAKVSEKYLDDSNNLESETRSKLQELSSQISPNDFEALLKLQNDLEPQIFSELVALIHESPDLLSLVKDSENASPHDGISAQKAENLTKLSAENAMDLQSLTQANPDLAEKILKSDDFHPEIVEELLELKKQLKPLEFEQFAKICDQFSVPEIEDLIALSKESPVQFASLVIPENMKSETGNNLDSLLDDVSKSVAKTAQNMGITEQDSNNLVKFSLNASPIDVEKVFNLCSDLQDSDKPEMVSEIVEWAAKDPETFKLFLAQEDLNPEFVADILELKNAVLPDEFKEILQSKNESQNEQKPLHEIAEETAAKLVKQLLSQNESQLSPDVVEKLENLSVKFSPQNMIQLMELEKGLSPEEFDHLVDFVNENPEKTAQLVLLPNSSLDGVKKVLEATQHLDPIETERFLNITANCSANQVFENLNNLSNEALTPDNNIFGKVDTEKLKSIIQIAECCEPSKTGDVFESLTKLQPKEIAQLEDMIRSDPETLKELISAKNISPNILTHLLKIQPMLNSQEFSEIVHLMDNSNPDDFQEFLENFEHDPEQLRELLEDKNELSKRIESLVRPQNADSIQPSQKFSEKVQKLGKDFVKAKAKELSQETEDQLKTLTTETSPENFTKLIELQSQLNTDDFEKFVQLCDLKPDILKNTRTQDPEDLACIESLVDMSKLIELELVPNFVSVISNLEPEELTELSQSFKANCANKDAKQSLVQNLNSCLEITESIPVENSKKLFQLTSALEPAEFSELIDGLKSKPEIFEQCLKSSNSNISEFIHLKADLDLDDIQLKSAAEIFTNFKPEQFESFVNLSQEKPEEVKEILTNISDPLNQMKDIFSQPSLSNDFSKLADLLHDKTGPNETFKFKGSIPSSLKEQVLESESLDELMAEKIDQILDLKSFDEETKDKIKLLSKKLSPKDLEQLLELESKLSPESFVDLVNLSSDKPRETIDLLKASENPEQAACDLINLTNNLNPEQKTQFLDMGAKIGAENFEKLIDSLHNENDDVGHSKVETGSLEDILDLTSLVEPNKVEKMISLYSKLDPEKFHKLAEIGKQNDDILINCLEKGDANIENLEKLIDLKENLAPVEFKTVGQLYAHLDDDEFLNFLEQFYYEPESVKDLLSGVQSQDELKLLSNSLKGKKKLSPSEIKNRLKKLKSEKDRNFDTTQDMKSSAQNSVEEMANNLHFSPENVKTLKDVTSKHSPETVDHILDLKPLLTTKEFTDILDLANSRPDETSKILKNAENDAQKLKEFLKALNKCKDEEIKDDYIRIASKATNLESAIDFMNKPIKNANDKKQVTKSLAKSESEKLDELMSRLIPLPEKQISNLVSFEHKSDIPIAELLNSFANDEQVKNLLKTNPEQAKHLLKIADEYPEFVNKILSDDWFDPKILGEILNLHDELNKPQFEKITKLSESFSPQEFKDALALKKQSPDQFKSNILDELVITPKDFKDAAQFNAEKFAGNNNCKLHTISKLKNISTYSPPEVMDKIMDLKSSFTDKEFDDLLTTVETNKPEAVQILKRGDIDPETNLKLIKVANKCKNNDTKNDLLKISARAKDLPGVLFISDKLNSPKQAKDKENLLTSLAKIGDSKDLDSTVEVLKPLSAEKISNLLKFAEHSKVPLDEICKHFPTEETMNNLAKTEPTKAEELIKLSQEFPEFTNQLLSDSYFNPKLLKDILALKNEVTPLEFEEIVEKAKNYNSNELKKFVALSNEAPLEFKKLISNPNDKFRIPQVEHSDLKSAAEFNSEKIAAKNKFKPKTAQAIKDLSTKMSPDILDKLIEQKNDLTEKEFNDLLNLCSENPAETSQILTKNGTDVNQCKDLAKTVNKLKDENSKPSLIRLTGKVDNPTELFDLMKKLDSSKNPKEKQNLLESLEQIEDPTMLASTISVLNSMPSKEISKLLNFQQESNVPLKDICENFPTEENLDNLVKTDPKQIHQVMKLAKDNPLLSQQLFTDGWFDPELINEILTLQENLSPAQFEQIAKIALQSNPEEFQEILALRQTSPNEFKNLLVTENEEFNELLCVGEKYSGPKNDNESFAQIAAEKLNNIAMETGLEAGLSEDFVSLSSEATGSDLDKLCSMRDELGETKFAKLVNLSSVYSKEMAKLIHSPEIDTQSVENLLDIVDNLDGRELEKLMNVLNKSDKPEKVNKLLTKLANLDSSDNNHDPDIEFVGMFLDLAEQNDYTPENMNLITNALAEIPTECIQKLLEDEKQGHVNLAEICSNFGGPQNTEILENISKLDPSEIGEMIAIKNDHKQFAENLLNKDCFDQENISEIIELHQNLTPEQFAELVKAAEKLPSNELRGLLDLRQTSPDDFETLLIPETDGPDLETRVIERLESSTFAENAQTKLEKIAAEAGIEPSALDNLAQEASSTDLDQLTELKDALDPENFQKLVELSAEFPKAVAKLLHCGDSVDAKAINNILEFAHQNDAGKVGALMEAIENLDPVSVLKLTEKLSSIENEAVKSGKQNAQKKPELVLPLLEILNNSSNPNDSNSALNILNHLTDETILENLVKKCDENALNLVGICTKFPFEQSLDNLCELTPEQIQNILEVQQTDNEFAQNLMDSKLFDPEVIDKVSELHNTLTPNQFTELVKISNQSSPKEFKDILDLSNEDFREFEKLVTPEEQRVNRSPEKEKLIKLIDEKLSEQDILTLDDVADPNQLLEKILELHREKPDLLKAFLDLPSSFEDQNDMNLVEKLVTEKPELLKPLAEYGFNLPASQLEEILKSALIESDESSESKKKSKGRKVKINLPEGQSDDEDIVDEGPLLLAEGDSKQLESSAGKNKLSRDEISVFAKAHRENKFF